MNVVMIGLGYVGLTTGLGFARLGATVVGVEVDALKRAQLLTGKIPFFEEGLEGLLQEMTSVGKFCVVDDLSLALAAADVVVIAVGTPPDAEGRADMRYIDGVTRELALRITRPCLIAIKSTVPVGTNRRVLAAIHQGMQERGLAHLVADVHIASLPEFLREGSALQDMMHPDRLVVGVSDPAAFLRVQALHRGIEAPWHVLSLESAELTKYASNAFLATKISFVNELANVAEVVGGDITEIAAAIGADHRIGPAFLEAGIGYGGSCFPKDVSALQVMAGEHGYAFRLLSAVIEVNNDQKRRFFQKVLQELGSLQGKTIAIWGIAFKPGTDDTRESIGREFALWAHQAGATVRVFDPKADGDTLPKDIVWCTSPEEAAQGSDAVLLATAWERFLQIDYAALAPHTRTPRLFDGRNQLRALPLAALGWHYRGIGRAT